MGNGGNAIIHGYIFEPGYLHGIFTIFLFPLVGGFLGIVGRLAILWLKRKLGRW